jgi:hypothetical protein
MFNDLDHPNITLAEWQDFLARQKSCKEPPMHLIEEVIDRCQCCVAKWFVPLARGAAVASDTLLRSVGHRPGMGRPRGWCETSPDYFTKPVNVFDLLMVRECDETNLWTVERLNAPRRHVDDDDILVHVFGSTPIFTRSAASAMRLAMYCHKNIPPSVLRWIKASPINGEAAIELAKRRQEEEAFDAVIEQMKNPN